MTSMTSSRCFYCYLGTYSAHFSSVFTVALDRYFLEMTAEETTAMNKFIINIITNPVKIYLFKLNNRNTRKRCEICSKLTIKTPERRH